jgi:DNA-binding response OmpR family regulator
MTPVAVGDLVIDAVRRRVRRQEHQIELTAREFDVLHFLVRHRGEVLSKSAILDGVWDYAFEGDPNIVEVYIARLRRKLDRPFGRRSIETVRGAGYRITEDAG